MKRLLVAALFAALFAVAVYAHSVGFDFVWDDHILIVGNAAIKPPAPLVDTLTKDIHLGSYWRPLVMLSFALNWRICNGSPACFHATQILLHASAAILVLIWLYLLVEDLLIAALAAVLFALHPFASETVCFISARDNAFAFLAIALAGIAWTLWRKQGAIGWLVLFLFSVGIGVFAKETVAIALMIPFVYDFFFVDNQRLRLHWDSAISGLIVVGVVGVYFWLRSKVLVAPIDYNFVLPASAMVLGFPYKFGMFVSRLFLPILSNPDYFHKFDHPTAAETAMGLGILVAYLTGLVLVWRYRARAVLFWMVFVFAYVFPFAAVLDLPGRSFTESWLYPILPMPALVYASLLVKLRDRASGYVWVAAIVVVLLGFSVQAYRFSLKWRNNKTLAYAALDFDPTNARAYDTLAFAMLQEGNKEAARRLYIKAIEVDPKYRYAYGKLVRLYIEAGNFEAARQVIRLAKDYVYWDLGLLGMWCWMLYAEGKYNQAVDCYKDLPEHHWTFKQRNFWYGLSLYLAGNRTEGLKWINKYFREFPYDEFARKVFEEHVKAKPQNRQRQANPKRSDTQTESQPPADGDSDSNEQPKPDGESGLEN